jgi:hypothetical protein
MEQGVAFLGARLAAIEAQLIQLFSTIDERRVKQPRD